MNEKYIFNLLSYFKKANSTLEKQKQYKQAQDLWKVVKNDQSLYAGHIQVYFESVQLLWAPKKTAQIFLQVQINNRIFH